MKSVNLLVLLSIFQVDSERWYSATVIESQEPFRLVKESLTNYVQETLLPIRRSDDLPPSETSYNDPWHYKKRKLITNGWKPLLKSKEKNVETKIKKIRRKLSKLPRKNARVNKTRTRFLEVFEVVEFDHVSCTSSSGLEGSCLHEIECQSSGGIAMGSCADGYGTCCVNLLACDSMSSAAAVGWFTNPDFPMPSTERLSCAVTLTKYSEDVTQIRLDFTSFELLPPTDGNCQLDQFVVSGQNINNVVPILCGINTGQHLYIEVGETEGPIYFSIQTETADNRLFSIKVTQLTPSDELTAPPGCLQYFTGTEGSLESFNYRDQSDIAITRSASYLNNLNYAMCIERAPGSCSVTYTAGYLQIVNYDSEQKYGGPIHSTFTDERGCVGTLIDAFRDGLPVIPPGQAGVEIFNCPSDWLLISAVRLCGERLNDGSVIQDFSLNAPVTDNNAGPIVVWFRSDEGYVARGFRLQYEQKQCAGPIY